MTFFDRYAGLMEEKGLDPGSQTAADMMGVTRSAISIWKRKGTTPKGDTVAKMADVLHVSADYLLGRTNDPTDYARKGSGTVVFKAADGSTMEMTRTEALTRDGVEIPEDVARLQHATE